MVDHAQELSEFLKYPVHLEVHGGSLVFGLGIGVGVFLIVHIHALDYF